MNKKINIDYQNILTLNTQISPKACSWLPIMQKYGIKFSA